MIRLIILLIMYFVTQLLNAQNSSAPVNTDSYASISVEVPDIAGDKGEVLFALYDSEEHFNMRESKDRKKSEISDGKAKVVFEDVTPGIYAILCFHDVNGNGRLDFNEMGIPLEPYGSSNNVFRMGPPLFEDAKFTIENKSLDLTIKF